MPSLGSRRGGRSGAGGPESAVPRSGVLVATPRCLVLWRADARPLAGRGWLACRPVDGKVSAGSLTLPRVEDKQTGMAGGSAVAVAGVRAPGGSLVPAPTVSPEGPDPAVPPVPGTPRPSQPRHARSLSPARAPPSPPAPPPPPSP